MQPLDVLSQPPLRTDESAPCCWEAASPPVAGRPGSAHVAPPRRLRTDCGPRARLRGSRLERPADAAVGDLRAPQRPAGPLPTPRRRIPAASSCRRHRARAGPPPSARRRHPRSALWPSSAAACGSSSLCRSGARAASTSAPPSPVQVGGAVNVAREHEPVGG